jgi:SAM-dependent methyltransferase
VVPVTAACRRSDFADLADWFRTIFPWAQRVYGPDYPIGVEYRKHWEVVQAVRALTNGGVLTETSELLGVGAGTEPTIFWLTNHAKRVFATDLYLGPEWEESANSGMLTNPGRAAVGPWNPRRLVVQHMDAMDLQYEDESFDGVFSSSSIEHFGDYDDVRRSVKEAYRVLRVGGIFSVSTELRLSGPPPGLPGILMFDWEELGSCVIDVSPWELLEPMRTEKPETDMPIASFEAAAAYLQSHVANHGQIAWDDLHWPEYPHIVLSHSGLTWTSVHLALRKR